MKSFKTAYGHFSGDGKEYVVTTPQTPRPWINVMSNGDYGIIVSQTGSGYSWRTHAQLNRLTRWEQDLIRDEWGKYLYLRDEQGNVWSAGWKPVCNEPESYECRHAIGYTCIRSSNFGVETELLMFVPNDEPMEIWKLTIRNETRRRRRLKLFTYLEWGLGAAPDWHREFHKSFIKTEYDAQAQAIFATKRLWEVPTDRGHWNADWPYVGFHSSSVRPTSFDGDKESFLGMYGSLRLPDAVKKGMLAKHVGNWLDPIASLAAGVNLGPRQMKSICFTLGAADSASQARILANKYHSVSKVDKALNEVTQRWERILSTVHMETPDAAMNIMGNTWLKYQSISGRMWGRTAYYQTGGAFGFRDQLQDSQIFLPIDPEQTKKQILLHARHQFRDGSVYHWWHPISELGLHNQISDNLLWLPFVVNSYIQETNDLGILDLKEPFVDDAVGASLYHHCVRAIDRVLKRSSTRGLPLIGGGDWNDGLSAVGLDMKGESVWLAHFLHKILLDIAEIAVRHGDQAQAREYRERARELKVSINRYAWDGGWYFRATMDSGEKLGSIENKEGRLYLNAQTWAVIAGIAEEERAESLMDLVEKALEFKAGPILLHPSYTKPDKYIGYLTRYSPGMRENGGVYTHAATWSVIAEAMLGRGESAFRIYSKLNPINRGKEPDEYCAEPYVTSGNIEGPDSAFYGRGGWTWYSGSAAWLFKVGLEWILGVRPTTDGLLVDPCIPSAWNGFKIRRTFRGATYSIEVKNPEHVECGVKALWVDGERQCISKGAREKVIQVLPAGTKHLVEVVLGRA